MMALSEGRLAVAVPCREMKGTKRDERSIGRLSTRGGSRAKVGSRAAAPAPAPAGVEGKALSPDWSKSSGSG